MSQGYSAFLPTIINGLGKWTSAEVQLLTVPCYFLGAATYMAVAVLSDRYQRRAVFTVIFGIVSVVGYAVLISPASSGVHYFGYVHRPLEVGLADCLPGVFLLQPAFTLLSACL